MAKLRSTNNDELSKVVNQIEDEEARELGDTEISEDGYVHDVPLLAGYKDKDGVIHSTFTYREMNGKDEEAINKGDVRTNAGRISNVLIERCVSEIGSLKKKEMSTADWSKVVRGCLAGDLDYMSFKIREISKGKEVTFEHTCPECKTKLKTVVSTDEYGIIPFNGSYEVSFELPRGYKDTKGEVHKTGTIRMVDGADREIVVPLFRKNKAIATTKLITRLIKFDDGAVVTESNVSAMTLRDREYLEKIMSENGFGLDPKLEIECSSCGADLSEVLGTSNFF